MKLRELWLISPQTHIFIRKKDNTAEEYLGQKSIGKRTVEHVLSKNYPNYGNVIEVILKEGKVIDAGYEETGGGCMTYFGSLDNGEYFILGQNNLMFCDSDPKVLFTEEFFNESGGDTLEWEKAHKIWEIEFPTKDEYATNTVKKAFEILKEKYGSRYPWDTLCEKELLESEAKEEQGMWVVYKGTEDIVQFETHGEAELHAHTLNDANRTDVFYVKYISDYLSK